MKVAIMQPYFFPYLGYFSLVKHTDRFILLDTVQFIYHGWIERNRILKPQDGWQYIKAPLLRHKRESLICDIKIRNEEPWQVKILAQLRHYKQLAPHFYEVMQLCESILFTPSDNIASFNASSIQAILKYLNIHKSVEVFSNLPIIIDKPQAPDEWALNICKAINVSEYWNPPGGKHFFNPNKYINSNIFLRFHEVTLSSYNQQRPTFEPGLSILDVLMFNSIEEVNRMLDNFILS